MNILLELKAEYKKGTGHDWKPAATPAAAAPPAPAAVESGDSSQVRYVF